GSPYAITAAAAEGTGLGNYAITYDTGSFDVTPAPLTITPDDQSKTYGELFAFDGTEFVATGLLFSDAVTSLSLTSAGAAADAPVAGSPYAITGSAAEGSGLGNYAITYDTGSFDVAPAPLTITPDDQSKTYGELFTFDGTEFVATGLLFSDAVTSLALTSAGAAADATVAGSPYAITGSAAEGTGLGNYAIAYDTGALDVTPAPLTITPDDQSKTYGELFAFDGTEFVATGLLFSDAVTSLALTSAGAAADATVAGSPYAITGSAAEGTGLGNYAITYDTGSFDVTPAPLTITPDDQSKTYGELFTFDGTEFVATGLLFSDAVTSLSLTSAGAAADASVAGSPYAITAAAAEGTGLGNYAITYDTGSFDVTPAPLTITPDDQSKTYGELFTFDGTEFVATGLRLSDTVVSVDLASAGAAADAPVAGSPYAITGAGAAGTGLNNYTITYNTGDLDVAPAPLTITPDNIRKVFGELYVFDGTEFTATGLLFSDVVTSLTLASAGAAADAPVAGSPYAITASNPVGTGLGNYVITLNPPAADGGLTVTPPTPAQDVPTPEPDIGAPPNPADELGLILAGFGTEEAARTLNAVLGFAATLEVAADACSQNLADTDRYLACLSDALDDFANELDAISTQLPPGMEDVAQIVRTARVRTDAARARAASRLAGATTDAERSAIRRDALNEARAAVGTAASEIRKAISFARAEDPELAALQTATVTTVAAAVDSVGIKLSRAVGL
ncbi:MBG domain-containing protein, partial [Thalassococcus profundi]